jgi:peroxiredoxin family protein
VRSSASWTSTSRGCGRESGSDTIEGVLAAILESGEPERLYTGLSLLVCAASDGEPVLALATFGALRPLLDPELAEHARVTARHVVENEREAFSRTLAELRDTAFELCRIWACAAAVEAVGAEGDERLEGVISTPRFLREAAGARLVVV